LAKSELLLSGINDTQRFIGPFAGDDNSDLWFIGNRIYLESSLG
jgi:hypothetical protein